MPFDHGLWLKRIQDSEGTQTLRHAAWERSRKLFTMEYWADQGYHSELADTITPVNYTTTFVRTLIAAVFARNPKQFIRARSARYDLFASNMEDVLEYLDDEQEVTDVYLEILIDALICNIGWAEQGFIPDTHGMPTPETGEQLESKKLLEKAIEFLKGKETPGVTEPHPPIATHGMLHEKQEAGHLFLVRRSPYDVLWPYGFHRYYDLPFLILHERRLLEDFMADPSFKHKDRVQGIRMTAPSEGGRTGKLVGPSYSSTSPHPYSDQQVVHLYTIWDRRSQTVTTISKESSEPHRSPHDWPYFSEGFPLIPLQFNLVPDTPTDACPYGFSDIEPIIPAVIEKSNIRNDAVDHRRRASTIVFVQEATSTADALEKMQEAVGYSLVSVPNIEAIKVTSTPGLPPEFIETESMINSDLDRESQLQLILSDTKRAASFERATVATIAQGNANLGTGYKLDRLEKFFKKVAHYRLGLVWQYMTRVDVGEILGEMPDEESWPSLPTNPVIARERVRRELELKIQPGSTRPIQDDVLDREQFLRATAIFQSVAPELFSRVKREWMASLVKKFRDPTLERLVKEATDSNEEEIAQQETQLLLVGHPQVVQGDDQSHLAIHASAANHPLVKQAMEVAAAQGQSHPLHQHLLGHAQKLKARQGGQRKTKTQKGTQQSSSAPSGPETSRMGTPSFMDIAGQSQNLRSGTGPVGVGSL